MNILNPKDYGIDITAPPYLGSSELFADIDNYLVLGGKLYLTKVSYQLPRLRCTIGFFTNILMYDIFSLESGVSSLSHNPWPGF